MELSLSEIESRADALTLKLVHANTGRQEALQLGVQIEGLRDLAQIKATVAHQARADVQAKLGLPVQMPWAPSQIIPRDNEPTKPVADRLHELVSRWQHFAESLDDAGVVEGSKDDGVMTATRVCAIELNDLLMEGGI